MNILIIDGHIRWARVSTGKLNKSINQMAQKIAREKGHKVRLSTVDRNYSPLDEVEKFLWADKVIIHFPVNWFSLPGKFKIYLDTVLVLGSDVMYKGDGRALGGEYGTGGLLTQKKYILISTWNAPKKSFCDSECFFGDSSPDTILQSVHKIFQYIGMQKDCSFAFLDVYRNEQIVDDLYRCKQMLMEHL